MSNTFRSIIIKSYIEPVYDEHVPNKILKVLNEYKKNIKNMYSPGMEKEEFKSNFKNIGKCIPSQ